MNPVIPAVVALVALAGLILLLVAVSTGSRGKPSGGAAAVLALVVLLSSPNRASSEPTPANGAGKSSLSADVNGTEAGATPDAGSAGRFDIHEYAGSGRLWLAGPDRKVFVCARVDARLSLPLGAHLLGRLDATAQRDGDPPTLEDPQTFTTLEGTGAVTRPIAYGVGPVVGYGWTIPIEAGRPALVERYPRRMFAGVIAWHPEGWALAALGTDEASGAGTRLIFAAQKHVTGRTYVGADGALPGLVRSYVLVRLGGE